MKGLIAFSIISLLAGAQSFTGKAQAIFHSQAPFHSQGEIHESITAKLHDKEPWEVDELSAPTETPEATENPEESPTATPTPTATPIETATPTATPTESPTASPTVTTGVNLGTGTLQDLLNQIIKFFQSLGH